MDTQDDLNLGTAVGPEDLQQGQSDATLLKQVLAEMLDPNLIDVNRHLTDSSNLCFVSAAGHDQ